MSTEQQPSPSSERGNRHLSWDACRNVRDVGGYETDDGGRTRWRALLRSDNLCRLTPEGRDALVEYGVRTIIDLRSPSELAAEVHPFALPTPHGPITYLNLPFVDESVVAATSAAEAAETSAESYCVLLEWFKPQLKTILSYIAEAAPGGVLVHCHAGKDRTGIIVALLLTLAGVPRETIAADYALSDSYLQPLYAEILDAVPEDQREALAHRLSARPETMREVLSYLDRTYGGVREYLLACGVSESNVSRLRERLRA